MNKKNKKIHKISICFFGITRDLDLTFPSIKKNIINPSKKYGELNIYCHFFETKFITNKRSNENRLKLKNNWDLIEANKLISEPPNKFLKSIDLEYIYKHGDYYDDNFKSIINLLHQLYSLNKAFEISKSFKSDLTIFLRPDLLYLDSFENLIKKNLYELNEFISIPDWQSWRGLNDRFAICNSYKSANVYSARIYQIFDYLNDLKRPLHSEELLYYAIKKSKLKIKTISNSHVMYHS